MNYINNGNTISTITYTNNKVINNAKYPNTTNADRTSPLGNMSSFSSNFSRENSINNNQKYSNEMIIKNDYDK